MKYIKFCLALIVMAAPNASEAFVTTVRNDQASHHRSTPLLAGRYGRSDKDSDAVIRSILDGGGECPYCAPTAFTFSPREARVKGPVKALFALGVMNFLASPALAGEIAETATVTETKVEPVAKESPALADETTKTSTVTETKVEPVAKDSPALADETTETSTVAETKVEPVAKESPALADETTETSTVAETKVEPVAKEKPKRSFDTALAKYFPSAMPVPMASNEIQIALVRRGFSQSNTIFGTSVCPDEVNSKPTKSLSAILQDALTESNGVFNLGGLGGIPFAGISGMQAFMSHTPEENGRVVILYGPHVGINDKGVVGRIERSGQQKRMGVSCDAVTVAYRALQRKIQKEKEAAAAKPSSTQLLKKPSPSRSPLKEFLASDEQQAYLKTKLRPYVEESIAKGITEEEMPAYITKKMYSLVNDAVMEQLHACMNDKSIWKNINEIVVVGGITISRGEVAGSAEPRDDYFQPMAFQSYVYVQESGDVKGTDLYPKTFGDTSA